MAEQQFRVAQGCLLLTIAGPKGGGEIVTPAIMGNNKKSIESNIATGHIIPINVDEHGEANQAQVLAEKQPGVTKGAKLEGAEEGAEPSKIIVTERDEPKKVAVTVAVDTSKPLNAADLADVPLDRLNKLVEEKAPGTVPFETNEEAVAFLTAKPKATGKKKVTVKKDK